jgi:hypothetical protein
VSFDFHPKNKDAGDFSLGAFSWPVLLESFGYLFPCVNSKGQYCCDGAQREWIQIGTNDGFAINATDAKLMARCARNFVAIQRGLPDKDPEKWPGKIRADFIDRFEKFADWAEKSGGFRIY